MAGWPATHCGSFAPRATGMGRTCAGKGEGEHGKLRGARPTAADTAEGCTVRAWGGSCRSSWGPRARRGGPRADRGGAVEAVALGALGAGPAVEARRRRRLVVALRAPRAAVS